MFCLRRILTLHALGVLVDEAVVVLVAVEYAGVMHR